MQFDGVSDNTGSDQPLLNDSFYPAITEQGFIAAYRNESEPQATEINQHLQHAIYSVNAELNEWRNNQTVSTLIFVTASEANHRSGPELGYCYTNAVHCRAKERLLQEYRTASATGHGHDHADAMEDRIGEVQRWAWAYIRNILGKPSACIELI